MKNSAANAQTAETTTAAFAIGRGRFVKRLLGRSMRVVLICCIIPAVAACVGAFWDLRFLVLALMLLMILLPMVLSFLYFDKALTPYAAINIVNHRVEFLPGGLKITLLIPQPSEPDSGYTEEIEKEEPDFRESEVLIPRSEIKSWCGDSQGLTIALLTGKGAFLLIPYSAFNGTDSLKKCVDILRSYQEVAENETLSSMNNAD